MVSDNVEGGDTTENDKIAKTFSYFFVICKIVELQELPKATQILKQKLMKPVIYIWRISTWNNENWNEMHDSKKNVF